MYTHCEQSNPVGIFLSFAVFILSFTCFFFVADLVVFESCCGVGRTSISLSETLGVGTSVNDLKS